MKKLSVTTTHHETLWGWIYLPVQLLVLPIVLTVCNLFFNLNLSDAELNFMLFCVNFCAVAVIFHRFLIHNGKVALKKPLAVIGSALACFVFYIFSNSIIATVITYVEPDFYNVNDAYISTMVETDFFLMFVGTAILVPLTEEVLYRGLVFAGLYNRSRILAYLVSTLFFASIHIIGYIGSYSALQLGLCLLQYIPAGICLGWAYASTDSIWTPIITHMIINTLAVLTMR